MILIFYRNLEDFVTWIDTSAIRKHILEYNDEVRNHFVSFILLQVFLIQLNYIIW